MLRAILLFFSRQRGLRRFMETSRFAKPLTRRFVAGETLAEELAVARQLDASGYLVSLDHLGENVSTEAEARASAAAIHQALDQLGNLPATVSIKLTQFGLDLSDEICLRNVEPLVRKALDLGTRVEIDMESTEYTTRTLVILEQLHQRHGSVRAVIQAYLHRSEADIRRLNALGVPVRLCKGAYREPAELALQDAAAVDARYLQLAKLLLDEGHYPALATHDERMIAVARGYPQEKFEYQMLYGVRRELQAQLIREGYRLRLYVPYGDAWYPYFMRRLAERPANLWFVLRSMVGN
ncbi:MAG: proline dehydrogenase family protein [Bryobacteraceae bacterium]|nr:proline dehydrogenase family protein [Bryobacteraceae bacterium]